ncbi:MAG TPA: transglycosylase SLT domain-containing protein [Stellaceae bacterium]|nr:transglycosylase SLT domain-containing protein [Stellaceae bacterium]
MREAKSPRRLSRAAPRRRPWLLGAVAADSGGVFARSLAAVLAGAVLWTAALHFLETRLGAIEGTPGASEQLLSAIEDAGARWTVPRFAATKLPTELAVGESVRRAIAVAAARVGVARDYLVAVAALESSFNAEAKAPGTTAAGLYQFTEDTWLRAVKVFGARHGLADDASLIKVDAQGRVSMPRGEARAQLMRRRYDPAIAALMAAELARDNERRLAHLLGRQVTPAETYIGHFLGLPQAARLITAAAATPHVAAARLMPAAALSNPDVFGVPGERVAAGAIVAAIDTYFRRDVPRLGAVDADATAPL